MINSRNLFSHDCCYNNIIINRSQGANMGLIIKQLQLEDYQQIQIIINQIRMNFNFGNIRKTAPISDKQRSSKNISMNINQLTKRKQQICSDEHSGVTSRMVQSTCNKKPLDFRNLESYEILSSRGKYQVTMVNSDLLRLLKEENKNLKEQNQFLLNKIRSMAEKEAKLKDHGKSDQQVIHLLKEQNQDLKQKVLQLTTLVKQKAQIIQQKLQELTLETTFPKEQFKLQMNDTKLISSQKLKVQSQATSTNQSEVQELNNQFEALLYSCRVEQSPVKRKEIRKRLVQLTYQMKASRQQAAQ